MDQREELKGSLLGFLIVMLFIYPLNLFVNGMTIQFIWNKLIIHTFDVAPLLLWQGVAINILVVYISGFATSEEARKMDVLNKLLFNLVQAVFVMVITLVVSLFI